MATRYGINAIPRAILVDQSGKVVAMNARGPKLGEVLLELLGPVETLSEDSSTDESVEAGKTEKSES